MFCRFLVQTNSSIENLFQPLGVAGDSVEYKWAEADGSVTSMSPTGSKVWCCLGCFNVVVFVVLFLGDLGFFPKQQKVLITAGSKLVRAPKK